MTKKKTLVRGGELSGDRNIMAFHQEFFTLNNGNKIPAVAVVGTGTTWFKNEETESNFSKELVEQIKYALTLPGIVHLDAAECYNTYQELGQALRESPKPRDEIFITDKFSPTPKNHGGVLERFESGIKKMGVDYVDLYLIHSPLIEKEKNGVTLEEVWKDLEKLYEAGKAKNIGVSNFRVEDLQRILKVAKVKPQVNQIEFHAFLQNQTPGIVKFSQDNNIQLEAYTPLGPLQRKQSDAGDFYNYVEELAKKYGKTEAQVLLRWVTRRHVLPITTSSKPQRIQAAQDLFSFDLTDEEVKKITELGLKHKPVRLYWNDVWDQYNSEAQKP